MTEEEKKELLKKLEEDKEKLSNIKKEFGKEYEFLTKPIRKSNR